MEDQSDYKRAEKRVEMKMGFYVHCSVYVLVNALLAAINLWKSPQEIWFYWPLAGWGVGVGLHAWRIYRPSCTTGLKQRMIQRELDRDKKATDP